MRARRPRAVSYGLRLISILKEIWKAADYPWSLRLKALLPQWMPWIRRHFRLTAEIEEQLLRISPRAIDYRLRSRKRLRRTGYLLFFGGANLPDIRSASNGCTTSAGVA